MECEGPRNLWSPDGLLNPTLVLWHALPPWLSTQQSTVMHAWKVLESGEPGLGFWTHLFLGDSVLKCTLSWQCSWGRRKCALCEAAPHWSCLSLAVLEPPSPWMTSLRRFQHCQVPCNSELVFKGNQVTSRPRTHLQNSTFEME